MGIYICEETMEDCHGYPPKTQPPFMGVFELEALRLDEFVTILCFCSTIYAMFAGYKNVTRKHKGNYFVIALFCHTLYYRTLVVIAIIYESVIYSICP